MQLTPHMLTRPPMELDPQDLATFERLYAEVVEHGVGAEIPYDLSAPKWQFLCYLTDNKGVLVHGSSKPDIAEFEPRQSEDVGEFGNRKAVYAASDALWAMYFAVTDRSRGVYSLHNAGSVRTRGRQLLLGLFGWIGPLTKQVATLPSADIVERQIVPETIVAAQIEARFLLPAFGSGRIAAARRTPYRTEKPTRNSRTR
jgi:hypothetical protein